MNENHAGDPYDLAYESYLKGAEEERAIWAEKLRVLAAAADSVVQEHDEEVSMGGPCYASVEDLRAALREAGEEA